MATSVIGICAALEQARYGVWDAPADLLPHDYSTAVQDAGALAVILPVQPRLAAEPDEVLDLIDGLLLAGGADIDPAAYGAVAHPATAGTCPPRDTTEMALTRRAVERKIPVLGICRGMQLLNVTFGGTLRQHVPDVVGDNSHRTAPGAFGEHRVRLAAGSLAAQAAGEESPMIKSHHHQAIDELGEGLIITGWSMSDDLPEAIEAPANGYVLGVQWHPEADPESTVVASLVQAARARRP